ncbi:hypothetical protein LAG90_01190 [Marinilongibacter aquaticus]|uniref:SO2930 family diheme c-type cytochrome n=1 Tax=Marinilongibacter aquaticus TaxID=2975157 RepID=UPI0021BD3988|nr:SO2930 family diheme c-type cytochrome [Marinilongibacter aquaticus]UBM59271.1 hypothetical protein LAG90_01190 [Marinilongibacter aquaticus]
MKSIPIFLSLLLFVGFQSFRTAERPKSKLSEYGFFQGELNKLVPAENVQPYSLKTPLFSDYAQKLRFFVLPKGEKIAYNAKEVLGFPVGSVLIKTFYYPLDFRRPTKGRRLIETRLLLHEKEGWKALDYLWNEEQNEAFLEVAGETLEVKYTDWNGKKRKHAYSVPNLNQCKGCHNYNEQLRPIGPSARQLNSILEKPKFLSHEAASEYHTGNQLKNWSKAGWMDGLPLTKEIPEIADWQDAQNYSYAERARAWLDINCAHCHRPEGPANSSGLNLSMHNEDPTALGILKTPVAAGRAAANMKYDIVPGDAHASILVNRLQSTDPGVMMPELGRKTVHEESLSLIIDWINSMPAAKN